MITRPRGKTLMEACRLAVAMGTAAVLNRGSELCNRHDVENLLPQVTVYPPGAKNGLNQRDLA
ncbi:MAG: hypothetical protein V1823_01640 [Chloroflexota bacterium]